MPERELTKAVANHLRLRAAPGVVWSHIPNGERRDARTGALLKAMGVRPGMPDLVVVLPATERRGPRVGWLEVKVGRGRPSQAQRDTLAELEAAGCLVAVATGIDEALETLTEWEAIR